MLLGCPPEVGSSFTPSTSPGSSGVPYQVRRWRRWCKDCATTLVGSGGNDEGGHPMESPQWLLLEIAQEQHTTELAVSQIKVGIR